MPVKELIFPVQHKSPCWEKISETAGAMVPSPQKLQETASREKQSPGEKEKQLVRLSTLLLGFSPSAMLDQPLLQVISCCLRQSQQKLFTHSTESCLQWDNWLLLPQKGWEGPQEARTAENFIRPAHCSGIFCLLCDGVLQTSSCLCKTLC